MRSSLRCSGSQSVSQTINALISATPHHKVSIHYVWVASVRSPSWTFSPDWRSCVDSQVLFKAHLYVRALLRLLLRTHTRGIKVSPSLSAEHRWSATSDTWSASLSCKSEGRVTDPFADLSQSEWCFKSLNTWMHVLKSTLASQTFFLHTAEDDFRHAGYADEVVTEPSKVIVNH